MILCFVGLLPLQDFGNSFSLLLFLFASWFGSFFHNLFSGHKFFYSILEKSVMGKTLTIKLCFYVNCLNSFCLVKSISVILRIFFYRLERNIYVFLHVFPLDHSIASKCLNPGLLGLHLYRSKKSILIIFVEIFSAVFHF